MKKKFDFLGLALTSLLSFLGVFLVVQIYRCIPQDSSAAAVFVGALLLTVPMLLGFLGMRLSMWIRRRKYRMKKPKAAAGRLLAVMLAAAILGAAGQLLFEVEWQTYTVDTKVDAPMKGRHIVLLMDISGSMKNEKDACIEAACQLIGGMDETTTMQVIAFASAVTERCTSAYLPLTPENKDTLQEMIRSVNMAGGTNFNQPLDMAIKTLHDDMDPEYRSMILMLTDGKDSVENSIRDTLTDPDCGIELFTARITDGSDFKDQNVQALIDLAVRDFPIVQQTDGSVDMSDVLDTFLAAVNHQKTIQEEHKKLALGSDFILDFSLGYRTAEFWWRPVVQMAVFTLYAVLVSAAYYGKPDRTSLLLNLTAGLVTGLALVFKVAEFVLLLSFLCLGGFTLYEIEEVEGHV